MKRKKKVVQDKFPYERYYTKDANGKYKPCGYSGAPSLYSGLWLVKEGPGYKSSQNLVYLISGLPDPVDVQTFLKAAMTEEVLIQALYECDLNHMSRMEQANHIAKALYLNFKKKEKQNEIPNKARR